MNTKSRYEVISDLEQNKRDLIIERDGLDTTLKDKEQTLVAFERKK